MRRLLIGSMVSAAALLAAPAAQAKFETFTTPSKNIACMMVAKHQIRCDIMQTDNGRPSRPASCEFDWGYSYGVKSKGKGRRLCTSDSVFGTKKVLKYGKTFKKGGITCKSRTSGLTCKNKGKHGFFLSRGSQRVF